VNSTGVLPVDLSVLPNWKDRINYKRKRRSMLSDFLRTVISYFGKDKQQIVAIEEMAELIQQLSKFVIDHPRKSRENIVEEYTDVWIMLNQIKIIFDITDNEIGQIMKFKIERLKRFMETNPKEV
jgi:hypothetical protein